MKALVYTGPQDLEMRDVPEPRPGPNEVVVRVASSGICGSDMHAYLGHDERRPAPLILGHEAAGEVVSGPGAGRRVIINPLVSCGVCSYCNTGRENLCQSRQIISMQPREGAFAEYVAVPEKNLVDAGEALPFDKAALTEPIACGWHAVSLSDNALHTDLQNADCTVIGGGPIGVGAALVLAARGAGRIIVVEPSAVRREVVSDLGPFAMAEPGGEDASSADLVIDAVGFSATRTEACRIVRPGGVIVHIGLGQATDGLDTRRMTLQEITFIGSYTYTHSEFMQTATAIADGSLGELDWIDIRPLDEGARAFEEIRAGTVMAPKVVLKP